MKRLAPCLIILLVLLCACSSAKMSEEQAGGLSLAFAGKYDASELLAAEQVKLEGNLAERFEAVRQVVRLGGDYGFIVEPVGYNGPITLAVAIDGAKRETIGVRIIAHDETEHYVRDMEKDWFISRFAGKTALEYLKPVKLFAKNEDEVVCITGATVTTEAMVNGVNAAMAVFRELELNERAPDVPYKVIFEPGKGDGPVENQQLAIRAEGVVVAEVSLEDIKSLPAYRRNMTIHSSSGNTTHEFKGALLSDILKLADPSLMERYGMAYAVGVDDYMSNILMSEVEKENAVYVMYEDGDAPLKTRDGGDGGMRIVVLDDVFGQRFTNYLLEIALE